MHRGCPQPHRRPIHYPSRVGVAVSDRALASEPQGDIPASEWRNTPLTGVTHTEPPCCGDALTLETERAQAETSAGGGRGQVRLQYV